MFEDVGKKLIVTAKVVFVLGILSVIGMFITILCLDLGFFLALLIGASSIIPFIITSWVLTAIGEIHICSQESAYYAWLNHSEGAKTQKTLNTISTTVKQTTSVQSGNGAQKKNSQFSDAALEFFKKNKSNINSKSNE